MNDNEPHDLDADRFLDEVHSFEFWFQAVEGYLVDRPHGRREGLQEAARTEAERDSLITTLCNYCVAETAALEASSGMVDLAPNRHAKIFLATQVIDEARHLEVFLNRLTELGVVDTEHEINKRSNSDLLAFKQRLLELVASGDWEAALFAQNVILEAMEFTVFKTHVVGADPITAEVLEGVISDERRHLGFGENDLGRRLAEMPETRLRLAPIKEELDRLVLRTFESTLSEIGVSLSDQPPLGRDYLNAVERLGFGS